jgi:hypothetical protein
METGGENGGLTGEGDALALYEVMSVQHSGERGVDVSSGDSTAEAEARARENVLGKLRTAGGKGLSLSKIRGKSKGARGILNRTLETLVGEKSITRLVTSGRATWYLAEFAPSMESACEKLEREAREAGGVLLSRMDLKGMLMKAEAAYFTAALCRLLGEKVLVKLRHVAGKRGRGSGRETEYYLHRASLEEMTAETFRPESGGASAGARPLLEVYHGLVERNGFPDVEIAELHGELGIPMPEVSARILEECKAGRAVLSFGDWSLASEKTRSCAIEREGERYLRVRFQS